MSKLLTVVGVLGLSLPAFADLAPVCNLVIEKGALSEGALSKLRAKNLNIRFLDKITKETSAANLRNDEMILTETKSNTQFQLLFKAHGAFIPMQYLTYSNGYTAFGVTVGANREDVLESIPECSSVASSERWSAYFHLIGPKARARLDRSMQSREIQPALGKLIIEAEAMVEYGWTSPHYQKVIEHRSAKYLKLLSEVRAISENSTTIDFYARLNEIRRAIFPHIKKYCAKNPSQSVFMMSSYERGEMCGNCVAQTLLITSLFNDGALKLEPGYFLTVQLFADHIRPILYNPSMNLVLDLVTGKTEIGVSGSIYTPELLSYAMARRSGRASHRERESGTGVKITEFTKISLTQALPYIVENHVTDGDWHNTIYGYLQFDRALSMYGGEAPESAEMSYEDIKPKEEIEAPKESEGKPQENAQAEGQSGTPAEQEKMSELSKAIAEKLKDKADAQAKAEAAAQAQAEAEAREALEKMAGKTTTNKGTAKSDDAAAADQTPANAQFMNAEMEKNAAVAEMLERAGQQPNPATGKTSPTPSPADANGKFPPGTKLGPDGKPISTGKDQGTETDGQAKPGQAGDKVGGDGKKSTDGTASELGPQVTVSADGKSLVGKDGKIIPGVKVGPGGVLVDGEGKELSLGTGRGAGSIELDGDGKTLLNSIGEKLNAGQLKTLNDAVKKSADTSKEAGDKDGLEGASTEAEKRAMIAKMAVFGKKSGTDGVSANARPGDGDTMKAEQVQKLLQNRMRAGDLFLMAPNVRAAKPEELGKMLPMTAFFLEKRSTDLRSSVEKVFPGKVIIQPEYDVVLRSQAEVDSFVKLYTEDQFHWMMDQVAKAVKDASSRFKAADFFQSFSSPGRLASMPEAQWQEHIRMVAYLFQIQNLGVLVNDGVFGQQVEREFFSNKDGVQFLVGLSDAAKKLGEVEKYEALLVMESKSIITLFKRAAQVSVLLEGSPWIKCLVDNYRLMQDTADIFSDRLLLQSPMTPFFRELILSGKYEVKVESAKMQIIEVQMEVGYAEGQGKESQAPRNGDKEKRDGEKAKDKAVSDAGKADSKFKSARPNDPKKVTLRPEIIAGLMISVPHKVLQHPMAQALVLPMWTEDVHEIYKKNFSDSKTSQVRFMNLFSWSPLLARGHVHWTEIQKSMDWVEKMPGTYLKIGWTAGQKMNPMAVHILPDIQQKLPTFIVPEVEQGVHTILDYAAGAKVAVTIEKFSEEPRAQEPKMSSEFKDQAMLTTPPAFLPDEKALRMETLFGPERVDDDKTFHLSGDWSVGEQDGVPVRYDGYGGKDLKAKGTYMLQDLRKNSNDRAMELTAE